ncbi:MAG: DNA gyrase inhibitor YacG [Burkholderiales bacterium]|nr:DNA gyrase inhibitor YacG [Burkholderiales bacterium]
MKSKPREVACPQCGKLVPWTSENRYRPFCSERCKMIDLGAWANESYRLPAQEDDENPNAADES